MTGPPPHLVLLVEDDPINIELAADLLQVAGYMVTSASTAEKALGLAREQHFDVVIMDIALPRMDGLEATRRLKRDPLTADIPVLALTAQAMPGDKEKAIAAGCCAYITKPLDTRTFAQMVDAAIHKQGAWRNGR